MKELYPFGRMALAALNALIYGFLAYKGIEITQELIAGITGPTAVYTLLKAGGKTDA